MSGWWYVPALALSALAAVAVLASVRMAQEARRLHASVAVMVEISRQTQRLSGASLRTRRRLDSSRVGPTGRSGRQVLPG